MASSAERPLVLAHRAGNDLASLRRAEAIGVDLVEADVRLFRGRLDVRHLKTVGPVPVYWDRWILRSPRTSILGLEALLGAADPSTELMLDLKGVDPRLAPRVVGAVQRHGPRPITVCARRWSSLREFDAAGVRRIRSVGNPSQLNRLWRHLDSDPLDGVSVKLALLTEDIVTRLRSLTPLVMTWPVNRGDVARRLAGWGVNGLISDQPGELLSELA